jgi:hypothetical protein
MAFCLSILTVFDESVVLRPCESCSVKKILKKFNIEL